MSNQSYWAYIYCFHWFLRNLFVLATMNRLVVERKVEKISRTSKTMKIMNIGQAAGKKIWNDSIYCMFEKAEKSGGDVMVVLGFEWKAKIMKN